MFWGKNIGKWKGRLLPGIEPRTHGLCSQVLCHWATTTGQPPALTILYCTGWDLNLDHDIYNCKCCWLSPGALAYHCEESGKHQHQQECAEATEVSASLESAGEYERRMMLTVWGSSGRLDARNRKKETDCTNRPAWTESSIKCSCPSSILSACIEVNNSFAGLYRHLIIVTVVDKQWRTS